MAFDFDGTLTTRDSFTAFLRWKAGPGRYAAGRARLIPAALLYPFNRDRGRIKAAAARVFLGRMSRNEITAQANRFAQANAQSLFRPDAVRTWRNWRAQGAYLVIVTASPDIVVAPFARGLGADALIGTQLEFDGDDRFTGAFATPNCRGPQKVRRLRALFGDNLRLQAAYGDTSGDYDMLTLAEEPGYRVFRGTP